MSQREPQKVPLDRIRSGLRTMWRLEGLDSDSVIRSLSYNLIVYTSGDERVVEKTIEQMIEISTARLGRIICIQSAPDHPDDADAWVQLHCQVHGQHKVCGEVIVLMVGEHSREEIHSTVLSLLAPDVPVYLWWTECPDQTDQLYVQLAHEVDRVLVDSDSLDRPDNLVKLAALPDQLITDLAWTKLTGWRHQLAHLWDAMEIRDALNYLRSVDIVYVAPEDFASASRALLLLGWLSDRLEWEMVEAKTGPTGGYISHWRQWRWEGKAEIVESAYEGLAPGEIKGVYLQAGKQPPFMMPRMEYVEERQCIDVRLNDASPSARRHSVRYTPMSTAEALVEEIGQQHDPYYRLALSRAAQIVKSAHSP